MPLFVYLHAVTSQPSNQAWFHSMVYSCCGSGMSKIPGNIRVSKASQALCTICEWVFLRRASCATRGCSESIVGRMLHSRAAPASRVTEEEKFAGAAFNTEGGAGFALPFRLLLQNPIPLDHLYFIPSTCIHWKDAGIEKRLLTSTVTNIVGLKKRMQIRSSAIPCFMEHFIAFPGGNRLMLLCLLAWSTFITRLLRVLSLCGSLSF